MIRSGCKARFALTNKYNIYIIVAYNLRKQIMESLVGIIVGILLGVGLVLLYIAYRIKMVTNALDEYIDEALNTVKDSFITILVEKDNDTYYCYRKEDHQFVCQGKTVDEVKNAFKLKYPDKVAIVSRETHEDIVEEFKKAAGENSTSI